MSESLVYNIMILGCFGGIGLVLAALGWLYLRTSDHSRRDEIELGSQGIPVEAEVVDLKRRTLRIPLDFWAAWYKVILRYPVTAPDGTKQDFLTRLSIPMDDYKRLKIGDRVRIRYLAERPESLIIDSGARREITAATEKKLGIVLIVAGVFLVLFGIWFANAITQTVTERSAASTAAALQLSNTPDEPQKTATAQFSQDATATVEYELSMTDKISEGIADRLPEWKQVSDQATHRVLPPDTGLGMDEVEIDYGYCEDGHFYVYVWLHAEVFNMTKETWTILTGYAYIEDSTPADCRPADLLEPGFHLVQGSWFLTSGYTTAPAP